MSAYFEHLCLCGIKSINPNAPMNFQPRSSKTIHNTNGWIKNNTTIRKLTPLLKKLESIGYVTRKRSEEDERVVLVSLTDTGRGLKEKAAEVPGEVASCVPLTPEEAAALYGLLYKIIDNV